MKTSLPRTHSSTAGFSLVEVIIALGISAMGITSILGLLPHSIENMRTANDLQAEVRAIQAIQSEIINSRWKDAAGGDALEYKFNGKRYLFDDLGQKIAHDSNGTATTYVARVDLQPQAVTKPGGLPDRDLRRFKISVKATPLTAFNFDKAPRQSFRTYSLVIGGTGR